MLTGDNEEDKDFDVNNLYVNLDFDRHENTFTYKHPIIDHPSNYQMTVTKFFSKTKLPYIELHECKKVNDPVGDGIKFGDKILFDYMIQLRYKLPEESDDAEYSFINQNLFKFNNSSYSITSDMYSVTNRVGDFIVDDDENTEFIDYDQEYAYYKGTGWRQRSLNWYDTIGYREIYSLEEIYQMINDALNALITRYILKDEVLEHYKPFSTTLRNKKPMFFRLENEVPKLYILQNFLDALHNTSTPDYNIEKQDYEPCIRILFSYNLTPFLKGFLIEQEGEADGYYILNITKNQIDCAKYELLLDNPGEAENSNILIYRVFEGRKINMMEVSDYIGLAVTSPNFPIKEEFYPHYNFDFDKSYYTENRRRYRPYSEENIKGFTKNLKDTPNMNKTFYDDEELSNSNKEKILFLKYFGKDDDLNYINYENNDTNTALKMDLLNTMPLKEFTLNLFLIDRYNNFEPLYLKNEEVVKMQLHFKRIKGDERENRYIIEPKIPPQKNILEIQEIPEIDDEESNLMVPDAQPEKEPEEEEEEEEENLDTPPPEKRMYTDENESDSNDENELY